VIVVCDNDLAADEHVVTDDYGVRAGYMTPMTDSNMVANHKFGVETLTPVASNCVQPQAVTSGKILSHRDRSQAAKIGFRSNVDFAHSKLGGQHSVAQRPEWTPSQS
jgi:hypothetical protein